LYLKFWIKVTALV